MNLVQKPLRPSNLLLAASAKPVAAAVAVVAEVAAAVAASRLSLRPLLPPL
jgi:hypothetical protein